jgi:hypothetical protein
MIRSGIRLILSVLLQQFERLQYWYYGREKFMMYANEMGLGVMIYAPSLRTITLGI